MPHQANDTERPILRLGRLDQLPIGGLREAVAADPVIEVPLPNVGFAQDPNDLAYDYARALYALESLAPFGAQPPATEVEAEKGVSVGGRRVIRCGLVPAHGVDVKVLVDRLLALSVTHSVEDEHYEEAFDSWGDVEELLDRIHDRSAHGTLRFPNVADSYMAYAIAGSEEGTSMLPPRKPPEWAHGFWRSFEASSVGQAAYVSFDSWIIPRGGNLTGLLETMGGFPDGAPDLRPATPIQAGDVSVLVGAHGVTRRPAERHLAAAWSCVQSLHFSGLLNPDGLQRTKGWATSPEGSVAVLADDLANCVFFAAHLEAGAIEELFADFSAAVQTLGTTSGLVQTGRPELPWEQLDDEAFERLCYDVLITSERFDPSRVRKMGKSRSRDRGRDLIAYTRARLGERSKRVVIQCKLIRPGRSLGSTGLDVVDTISEDGAEGYLVMTNAAVDATLYDRLRAIEERYGWQTDAWGHMELERLLLRRPDIRSRYFGV